MNPAIAVPAYVAAQMALRQRERESALYDVDDDTNVSEREVDAVSSPHTRESGRDAVDEGDNFLVTLAAFVAACLGVGVIVACVCTREWAPVVMAVPLFAAAVGLFCASRKKGD